MGSYFRRQIVVSLIIIVGGFVVLGLALLFLSWDLSKNSSQAAADRLAVDTRSAALQSLASLKDEAGGADRYQKAMDKILVSSDQLINFSGWLTRLAQTHQVSANSSFQGAQSPPQGTTPGYINFSMSSSGDFNNLLAFLRDAELNSPQFLVSFDNFDLNRSSGGYAIALTGRVFFK